MQAEMGSSTRADLASVLVAYLNIEQAARDASRPGLGEIAVYDLEGKPIGHLLPPTADRTHASLQLIEGRRTIPLAMERAVRERQYNPASYQISSSDAARITKANSGLADARERDRSAAALRSRSEATAERARDPLVELREIFGDRIKGIPQVAKAFTVTDGHLERPLRTFLAREKLDIADALRAKLKTPEAKALLRVLKNDPAEAAHWVCILRIARLDRGTPLSFNALLITLSQDMRARHQGDLADRSIEFSDEYYFPNQTLQDTFETFGSNSEWSLVRVATVPGTNGLPWDEYEDRIRDFLTRKGLQELIGKTLHRTPGEALYDYAMLIRTSDDPKKDPLFRSPVREAIEIGHAELSLVIGPYNPHTTSGVEVELEHSDELQGEVGAVISF